MSEFLKGIPAVMTVGVVVGVFFSLQRQHRTARVRFWVIGWSVMFLHFVAALFSVSSPGATWIVNTVQLATLQVAGLAFLVSMTTLVEVPRLRSGAFVLMSIPLVTYAGMMAANSSNRLAYSCLAAWIFFGGAAWFLAWYGRFSVYVVCTMGFLASLGGIALWHIRTEHADIAFYTMLLAMYTLAGVLFARRFWRASAGVLLSCGGFFAWAGIWALAAFAPSVVAIVGFDSDLWNIPKLFVGVGMILTLLEEESRGARAAGERERTLNLQMGRFADITSRLLGGAEVRSLCSEIAQVITEFANFRRVAILLPDERNRLVLVGHAGVSSEAYEQLTKKLTDFTAEKVAELCAGARQIGHNSFICSGAAARAYAVSSIEHFDMNPFWREGDELLVPLRSAQGAIVGCILLDDPKDASRVTHEEMSKIEMLASDVAVAIENATLQRRIVLQEKMASVGQLVSGVAHELNNPLTAVMGYTELMSDSDTEGRYQRELDIIRREARRMKLIIDNLLRFARQAKTETKAAVFQQVLVEALNLRDYELKRLGVVVESDVPSNLPPVAVDEAQLKTVVVNLLSNAADAMQNSDERSVTVHARHVGERVVVSVLDTGGGFSDVTRVFDPFFTTKGPGRGTGLGLSICYGIVKQHGGDIYARNVHPRGACVSMELPALNGEEAARAHGSAATLGS
ncbi:MAG TPA: GAF domain-containing sensor histidine kinase [Clostridia bacterium]|nr:GAF domain-containing sensor histidine kinase [Clostridia bacterium]